MRRIWISLAALAWAAPAFAHDFWLQPKSFWIPPQSTVLTTILVGHGPDRQVWAAELDRIQMLRSVSAAGKLDHQAELKAGKTGEPLDLKFAGPGTQILAMETSHASSELPALRFNDYLKVEGLTPALQARDAAHKTEAPGREIYSRRAKVLIQVGPFDPAAPQPYVTKPLGLTLEIVPEINPYALKPNEPLPVQVLYEGKPLAGATVKLTNLDFDGRPIETHISDATGHATFNVPHIGPWLINVIWTKPLKGDPKADFDTTFSSLTFGFPRGRPAV